MLFTIALCSCSNQGKDVDNPEIDITDNTYIGKLTVDQNDGSFYIQEKVSIQVQKDDDNSLKLIMHKVKFSEKMPISLNMTIPGVSQTEISDYISIQGENIIPIAMGGAFPKYTIKNMTGKITRTEINFSLICGDYPLSFSGVVLESGN